MSKKGSVTSPKWHSNPVLLLLRTKFFFTHLIRWQSGEGLNDSSQGHLRLLGHVGSAWHVVGGATDEPRAGISWKHTHTTTSAPMDKNWSQLHYGTFYTLVFSLEVGGDQWWDLTSDPCGEWLCGFSFIILDHLDLQERQKLA